MKRASQSRSQSRPKRTSSPPRSVRVDLKPGEVLVTGSVIVMARMAGGGGGGFGATTTVTCECTKAEPDTPDCKPKTTTFPGGVSVSCKKSGGCSECKSTTTTTSWGVVMA
jgi:hypothetical protein